LRARVRFGAGPSALVAEDALRVVLRRVGVVFFAASPDPVSGSFAPDVFAFVAGVRFAAAFFGAVFFGAVLPVAAFLGAAFLRDGFFGVPEAGSAGADGPCRSAPESADVSAGSSAVSAEELRFDEDSGAMRRS